MGWLLWVFATGDPAAGADGRAGRLAGLGCQARVRLAPAAEDARDPAAGGAATLHLRLAAQLRPC
eukprot:5696297-Prymnesium_polylepis.1